MKAKISLNTQNPETISRRAQLEKDIRKFQRAGGKIQQIPDGKSANVDFSFVIHTGDKE